MAKPGLKVDRAMSSQSLDAEGKGKLPLEGLAGEWENEKNIRTHLQDEGAVLFPENSQESVKATCQDHVFSLLVPLLTRMACTPGAPQPAVDPLRDEIASLYKACSKPRTCDDTDVIHDSWMVRKFLGLVKMKARKAKPSTVIWMQSFLSSSDLTTEIDAAVVCIYAYIFVLSLLI